MSKNFEYAFRQDEYFFIMFLMLWGIVFSILNLFNFIKHHEG